MGSTWEPGAAGVLVLPSGRMVRGRGLRKPLPPGEPPEFALYLRGRRPSSVPWEARWVRWPDFWLPRDAAGFARDLEHLLERSATERVEVACGGGIGRTGTALACLAILDGVPREDAVSYVRANYHRHAVETPWQKRFVARFP